MQEEISLKELIKNVCLRPGMFTPKGTFNEVYSLILGYTIGRENTILSGENWRFFNKFGCVKFGFPTKYVLSYVIESCTKNDEEAIKLLEELINEFSELNKQMTMEEVINYAETTFKYEEGEPEKIYRIFNEALLNGNKQIIKPLIEEHEHQNILWKGSYPKDVGKLLNQISKNQPIRKIYESDDKNKIRLISVDLPFPIEMNFKDGNWKIDATKLIELRLSQQKD